MGGQGSSDHSQYSQGLSNAPSSYMEDDDDSDEDVGKTALNNQNINYDDDDKGDEEMMGAGSSE